MKKIGAWLFAALIAVSTVTADAGHNPNKNRMTHNKVTQNKVTKTGARGVHKLGKGVKHGAYDLSHNKVTRGIGINQGNKKYKYKNDI